MVYVLEALIPQLSSDNGDRGLLFTDFLDQLFLSSLLL